MSEKVPIRRGEESSDVAVQTREKQEVKKPRLFKVLLHNDDYTTMDFVVAVLIRFFGKSRAEATAIMLQIHRGGIGLAGVYPKEVAETKAAQVTEAAKAEEMPLLATTEPE